MGCLVFWCLVVFVFFFLCSAEKMVGLSACPFLVSVYFEMDSIGFMTKDTWALTGKPCWICVKLNGVFLYEKEEADH